MNNIRPGNLIMLIGGAVLLIASFLDWTGPFSAWEGSIFGLTGLFLLLIAAEALTVAGIRSFAPQVGLPDRVLGFRLTQLVLIGGFAVFVLALSLLFRDQSAKIGTILGLLASGAIVAGAFLEDQAAGVTSSGPTQRF